MRKKLVLTAVMLLLCGCSHKTEVRDKGFVRTIGCDSGEVQSVAVRLYGQDEVLSGSGDTIFSALENAETVQGKTLFTGHLELLVLNPAEIRDKLSVMIKNNRISPSCSLIITTGSAADTVKSYEEEELSDILDSSSRKGKIVTRNISTVLNDLLEEDSMAAVPVLDGKNLTMGVVGYDSLVGVLSEEESEGLSWLTGSQRDIYLPISLNGKAASFHVRKSSTRLTAEADGENIRITTEIKINGSCIEENTDESGSSKAAAEKISGLCSKAISKTVTGMNADVLGIEKCIRSENLASGESWKEIIPRLQFYYSIKIAQ